jgi:3'(2'), 5'-bisphosphate nucleotidase
MLDRININDLLNIAREAGSTIIDIYRRDYIIELKDDNSPLTLADRKSNQIIISRLQELYPQVPYISEETQQISFETRRLWEYLWLIDPLDGTKEFIKKNGEFTVNIALIHNRQPVLGIIYAPALDLLYYAIKNRGSYVIKDKQPAEKIRASLNNNRDSLVIVGSRSHATKELEQFIQEKRKIYKEVTFISAGSALKFCLIAEGKADIYPRTGPTMEWDTAAGHALVLESGKQVYQFESEEPVYYNKNDLRNGWFIVR